MFILTEFLYEITYMINHVFRTNHGMLYNVQIHRELNIMITTFLFFGTLDLHTCLIHTYVIL